MFMQNHREIYMSACRTCIKSIEKQLSDGNRFDLQLSFKISNVLSDESDNLCL